MRRKIVRGLTRQDGGRSWLKVCRRLPVLLCDDVYITDEMNEKVEIELSGVDLETLGERFTYEELLAAPKMSLIDLYKREKQNEQNGCAR